MEIRNDIYPKLQDTYFWKRDEHIKRLIAIAHDVLEIFFVSPEEVIEYLNGFHQPKDAESFLNLCAFYNISKNHTDHDFLKFVMTISIIERMATQKYISFYDWIIMKSNQESYFKGVMEGFEIDENVLNNEVEK